MSSLQTPPLSARRAAPDQAGLCLVRILLPIVVLAAGVACMIRPAWERAFTSGAVDGYALTPRGWKQLLAAAG